MVEPKKGTKWPTNLPRFENRQDAVLVCKELCKNQFLLRSEKRGKGELGVSLILLLCAVRRVLSVIFSLLIVCPSFLQNFLTSPCFRFATAANTSPGFRRNGLLYVGLRGR